MRVFLKKRCPKCWGQLEKLHTSWPENKPYFKCTGCGYEGDINSLGDTK